MEVHKRNLFKVIRSFMLELCKYFILGKDCRACLKTEKNNTKGILDYVHSEVWGPTNEDSMGGSRYFVTLIDDFSHKFLVYFLNPKFEIFTKFKFWKAEMENQTGKKSCFSSKIMGQSTLI